MELNGDESQQEQRSPACPLLLGSNRTQALELAPGPLMLDTATVSNSSKRFA